MQFLSQDTCTNNHHFYKIIKSGYLTGCPAFATSVIEVNDGSGHGTTALKITSTENDSYLRDAPAVKIIIVRDQWGHRYMMDKFFLGFGLVSLTYL